jgi:hypothetical protein
MTTQTAEQGIARIHAEIDGIEAGQRYRAPTVMVAAVRAVPAAHRLAAMKLAEATFLAALAKLNSFDDFSRNVNAGMAADAAAAEVAYQFNGVR